MVPSALAVFQREERDSEREERQRERKKKLVEFIEMLLMKKNSINSMSNYTLLNIDRWGFKYMIYTLINRIINCFIH